MGNTIIVHSQSGVNAVPQDQRAHTDLVVEDAAEQVVVGNDFASVDYVNSKDGQVILAKAGFGSAASK